MKQKATVVSGNNVKNEHKQQLGEYKAPDVDKLLDQVIKLLEVISTPEMLKMREDKYILYEETLYNDNRFDEVIKSYSLFRKIIDHEDISHFYQMIEVIKKSSSGKEATSKFESIIIKDHIKLNKRN
jgi:hypothetical protein